ncbi:ankyrin repeat-containing domain protein, partial [Hyaloraphidium curvatum]
PSTADFDLEELLACARYGELDELRALVASHPAPPASLLALSSPSLHGGSAALHMACANGHVPVVRYLVEVLPKAALDARNEGGNTALHWASLNGHLEAVEALLKAGANPKVLNNARRDPLYEAESMGLEAVATLLVQYGAANDE